MGGSISQLQRTPRNEPPSLISRSPESFRGFAEATAIAPSFPTSANNQKKRAEKKSQNTNPAISKKTSIIAPAGTIHRPEFRHVQHAFITGLFPPFGPEARLNPRAEVRLAGCTILWKQH